MALAHQSIATINSPQFINLQPLDINPLMSSCQIKVFYLGENRNRSFISKEVATQMAKTLRGAPIVGYYKKDKQDFSDHGEQIVIDDDGIHFNCLTKPYGFVSPDAKVWFQDFQDQDEFGNTIIRKYLMTTGYLWTKQFEQIQQIFKQGGKPQSMELEKKSLQGEWSDKIKEGMDFFIINDAIFSKLCILGDDVQPCFQGAAITSPQASTSFTLDNNFKQTLFKMMQELTQVIKGGETVPNTELNETNAVKVTEFTEEKQQQVTSSAVSTFEKKEDETTEKTTPQEKQKQTEEQDTEEDDKDKKEDENKYNLLKENFNKLQNDYNLLKDELAELKNFKKNVEDKEKDELIKQFYMLSEEDKKDVIENKSSYTLDQIESKLAVICFKKKVNFNTEDSIKNEIDMNNNLATTFNIENKEDFTPDWVKAVESNQSNCF